MKKTLLLYSDRNEAVTQALLCQSCESFQALSLKELLKDVLIDDLIEDGVSNIEWTLPDGQKVTNSKDLLLINRVMAVEETLFDDFAVEDRDYAREEFIAYLSFAIASFPNKTADCEYLGMAGSHYPLPILWKKVNYLKLNINTPSHYYGPKEFSPLAESESVVEKSIFDHTSWKVKKQENISLNVFQVERPKGKPFLFLKAGNSFQLDTLEDEKLSQPLREEISAKLCVVAKKLDYFFCQALVFIHKETYVFASMSPNIFSSTSHKNFHNIIVEGVFS